MATKRVTSPIRRILNGVRAALFAVAGVGGEASVLVAKQLSERGPDHDIYDPAPRQPSHRHRGRRRVRRED
ncbi:MAG TPA: hypothetical protein VGB34_10225 [Candidatus Limnocylindria bacterium]|jgi:hypothetical protein